ncbi:MAG TPA: translational GTPase TypA [Candidatus Nanoarchaeia archaeon]|nr:translational GTPase TypA [Candidatus Nanoarchaeia archaeon]
MEIRNIAIIAHVDHGKTTLTDAMMRQNSKIEEGTSMDSNDLERERGITIYAKNTSIFYKGTKINIVDTPGHADFGSEVERVLRSIDSVLLVVDAQEGPMPQTRFVLKKSLELGLKPIVVINKIDKKAADIARTEEDVLGLFLELGASNEQADFPVVYAIGRDGTAKRKVTDEMSPNLNPLLDVILEKVAPASNPALNEKPLMFQPFNLGYDNFIGRLAIGRMYEGVLKMNQTLFVKKPDGTTKPAKITKLFTFEGLVKKEVNEVYPGDIAMIAGIPDIFIGDTITTDENAKPLPAIAIDEPTIALNFLVNNSPFAGKEGKFVTSRQIRDYLERELEINVGLKVEFGSGDVFRVLARGELHVEILLENMRRAGFELQVSEPEVIIHEENGVKTEPYEEAVIDIPSQYQGAVIDRLGARAFVMMNLTTHGDSVRLIFEGPTRGILGFKNQFVIDTKGEGIFSSRVIGFKPYAGEIQKRKVGAMVSMANGKALAFALWNLQERGELYIGPQTEVYEGMVIGNTSKGEELYVNPTKGKQLTNMRASGSDDAIDLVPPLTINIGRGLEIMSSDEYLEITPKNIRLRKQLLTEQDRAKAKRAEK